MIRQGSDAPLETTAAALVGLLQRRRLRLATGESCTGGLIAHLITMQAGCSAYYAGGVVAYSNTAKTALLNVPDALIRRHGAVSAAVAESMAAGALARLDADAAVAVTGVAGPSGGTPEKPVGLVFIGTAVRGAAPRVHAVHFTGARGDIQKAASQTALKMLYDMLSESG